MSTLSGLQTNAQRMLHSSWGLTNEQARSVSGQLNLGIGAGLSVPLATTRAMAKLAKQPGMTASRLRLSEQDFNMLRGSSDSDFANAQNLTYAQSHWGTNPGGSAKPSQPGFPSNKAAPGLPINAEAEAKAQAILNFAGKSSAAQQFKDDATGGDSSSYGNSVSSIEQAMPMILQEMRADKSGAGSSFITQSGLTQTVSSQEQLAATRQSLQSIRTALSSKESADGDSGLNLENYVMQKLVDQGMTPTQISELATQDPNTLQQKVQSIVEPYIRSQVGAAHQDYARQEPGMVAQSKKDADLAFKDDKKSVAAHAPSSGPVAPNVQHAHRNFDAHERHVLTGMGANSKPEHIQTGHHAPTKDFIDNAATGSSRAEHKTHAAQVEETNTNQDTVKGNVENAGTSNILSAGKNAFVSPSNPNATPQNPSSSEGVWDRVRKDLYSGWEKGLKKNQSTRQ